MNVPLDGYRGVKSELEVISPEYLEALFVRLEHGLVVDEEYLVNAAETESLDGARLFGGQARIEEMLMVGLQEAERNSAEDFFGQVDTSGVGWKMMCFDFDRRPSIIGSQLPVDELNWLIQV